MACIGAGVDRFTVHVVEQALPHANSDMEFMSLGAVKDYVTATFATHWVGDLGNQFFAGLDSLLQILMPKSDPHAQRRGRDIVVALVEPLGP